MKKKLGMYLIYLIYIFELIYTMSAMYFNSFMVIHKIEIFENIYQIAYCMIFIVGIFYILLLIYKVGHHESIDLKKSEIIIESNGNSYSNGVEYNQNSDNNQSQNQENKGQDGLDENHEHQNEMPLVPIEQEIKNGK